MVGDQVGDRARRLQVADVLALRLGERRIAAVGVVGPDRARAGAAPDPAVVAVRVGAPQAPGRVVRARAGRVLRRRVGRDAAVLALHLVVEQAVDPAQAGVLRLARDVEPVGIDDRHDDRAGGVDQVGRAGARAVVGQQVVGELDRVLRRRPLARVVDADLQEDRLAVGRLRVLRDLDAVDAAALDRLVAQRELLHEPRVAHRQLLHLEVVVREMAVLVAAGRQLRLRVGGRELRVLVAVGLRLRLEVGDPDRVGEAGVAQRLLVGRAVQHDLDGVLVAVLGQVEPERLQGVLVLARRADVDELHLAVGLLGDLHEAHRQIGAGGLAAEAAGLDDELLAALDEALGELARAERGRAGHEAAGVGVEDAEVPVTAARQPGADQPRVRRGRGDRLRARGAVQVARVARLRDGLRRRDLLVDGGMGGCAAQQRDPRRERNRAQRRGAKRSPQLPLPYTLYPPPPHTLC